jgi:hypothetical protein
MAFGFIEALLFGGATAKLAHGARKFNRTQESIRRGPGARSYSIMWEEPVNQPERSTWTGAPARTPAPSANRIADGTAYTYGDGWTVEHDSFFNRRRH